MTEILVFCETNEDQLDSTAGELLAAGQKLSSELSLPVSAVIFNPNPNMVLQAGSLGADKIYKVTDPKFQQKTDEVYTHGLFEACKQINPTVILAAKTTLGRNIAARTAYRLKSTVAQDCMDISGDKNSGLISVKRPVYGGNAQAVFTFTNPLNQVVILRVKTFEPLPLDNSKTSEEIDLVISMPEPKLKVIDTVKQEFEGVRLEDAAVIVGGGRGLGGPEAFVHLEELAKILNGAVGASRAVCDAGWLDHSYQIGLTGKTVTPDLYITIAISGASQHMAGCSASKNIVAINKDGDANIFKEASFGVVGDWEQILPSFTATARELTQS